MSSSSIFRLKDGEKVVLLLSAFLCAGSEQRAAAADFTTPAGPRIPANPALLHKALERHTVERSEGAADELREFTNPFPWLELHYSYKAEFLGNVSGGYRTGGAYAGQLQISGAIDLAKLSRLAALDGFQLGGSVWYPHGQSLSARNVHDLNGVSNIDAYDSFRLNELWLEKQFSKQASLRAGLLAADSEFFICNSGSLFINSCFGAIPTVSLNFDAPVYPLAAPAVRLALTPSEQLSVRLAVFSGATGQQDGSNRHGTRIKFDADDGLLFLAEGTCKTTGALSGAFTLGGFYHTGRFQDLRDIERLHCGDFGGYFIVDQTLFRPAELPVTGKGGEPATDRALSGFARLGADGWKDRNAVNLYAETGLVWKGMLASRPRDTVGVGFSYTRTSAGASEPAAPGGHEMVLEASYQVALREWLSFQPDLQYIIRPGADGSLRNALVIGARITLAF